MGFIPPELHGRPVIGVACCWRARWIAVRPSSSVAAVPSPAVDSSPPPFSTRTLFDPSYPHASGSTRRPPHRGADGRGADGAGPGVPDPPAAGHHRVALAERSRGGRGGNAVRSRAAGSSSTSSAQPMARRFEGERAWASEGWASIASQGTGVYVNWPMDAGQHRVQEAYGRGALRTAPTDQGSIRSRERVPLEPERAACLNDTVQPSGQMTSVFASSMPTSPGSSTYDSHGPGASSWPWAWIQSWSAS